MTKPKSVQLVLTIPVAVITDATNDLINYSQGCDISELARKTVLTPARRKKLLAALEGPIMDRLQLVYTRALCEDLQDDAYEILNETVSPELDALFEELTQAEETLAAQDNLNADITDLAANYAAELEKLGLEIKLVPKAVPAKKRQPRRNEGVPGRC